jgi:hypothetical protein
MYARCKKLPMLESALQLRTLPIGSHKEFSDTRRTDSGRFDFIRGSEPPVAVIDEKEDKLLSVHAEIQAKEFYSIPVFNSV